MGHVDEFSQAVFMVEHTFLVVYTFKHHLFLLFILLQ